MALGSTKHNRAVASVELERKQHTEGNNMKHKQCTYIRRDPKERVVQFHDVDELGQGRRRQVKGQEAVAPRGHARLRRRRHQLAPTSKRLVLRHRHLGQVAVPTLAVVRVGKRQRLSVNKQRGEKEIDLRAAHVTHFMALMATFWSFWRTMDRAVGGASAAARLALLLNRIWAWLLQSKRATRRRLQHLFHMLGRGRGRGGGWVEKGGAALGRLGSSKLE